MLMKTIYLHFDNKKDAAEHVWKLKCEDYVAWLAYDENDTWICEHFKAYKDLNMKIDTDFEGWVTYVIEFRTEWLDYLDNYRFGEVRLYHEKVDDDSDEE